MSYTGRGSLYGDKRLRRWNFDKTAGVGSGGATIATVARSMFFALPAGRTVGSASGTSTAAAVGASTAAAVGSSAGTSTALAVGGVYAPGYRASVAGGGTSGTGDRSLAITPQVGDLLVIICNAAGNSNFTPTCSDNQGGTYYLAHAEGHNFDSNILSMFVRTALVSSAVATTVTVATGVNDAAELNIIALQAMTKVGSAAVVKVAFENNASSGTVTPAPVFASAVATANVTVGAVGNSSDPSGESAPSGWTERQNAAQATPSISIESVTRDSGFTGTTITWTGASPTAYAAIVIELDTSSGGGGSTGAGSSAGTSTALAVGASVAASAGASAGTSTAAAVGASVATAVGSSAGIATAAGVGASVAASVGTSAGVATSSAVGASTAASAGASTGTSTASAVGASVAASAGVSAGTSTALAVSDTGGSVGVAAGTSTALAVGASVAAGDGASAGTSTAAAVGASTSAATGASAGTSTAAGVGAATSAAAGVSAGTSTVAGVGAADALAVGASAGTSTAAAVGSSSSSTTGVGVAAGTSTALGVGASTVDAVGSAAGTSTALASGGVVSSAVGSTAGTSTAFAVGDVYSAPPASGGGWVHVPALDVARVRVRADAVVSVAVDSSASIVSRVALSLSAASVSHSMYGAARSVARVRVTAKASGEVVTLGASSLRVRRLVDSSGKWRPSALLPHYLADWKAKRVA